MQDQRKYVLDLLKEIGLIGCKFAKTPMELDLGVWNEIVLCMLMSSNIGEWPINLSISQSLGLKFSYVVRLLNQFMHNSRDIN